MYLRRYIRFFAPIPNVACHAFSTLGKQFVNIQIEKLLVISDNLTKIYGSDYNDWCYIRKLRDFREEWLEALSL